MKDLLEAGVHFGHQTKRWNPKIEGIHLWRAERHLHHRSEQDGERNSATPRNSSRTWRRTAGRSFSSAPSGRPRTSSPRRRSAAGCSTSTSAGSAASSPTSPPFNAASAGSATSKRWSPTGGTTPSPRRKSPKSEKEKRKLPQEPRGHSAHVAACPDTIFVVDTRKEKIAVDEARKLKIPVIGIVDTNCDPGRGRSRHSRQ